MPWKPDYVTLTKTKNYLRVTDTDDDVELALDITAASRAVDLHCGGEGHIGRQFGSANGKRFYTARWDRHRGRWVVDIDDLMSTTNLDIQIQDADGVDLGAVDAYTLEPRNAAADGKPWTLLVIKPTSTFKPTGAEHEVAITAEPWGWTAFPAPVELATLLQTSRFAARRDSPFGIAGSPDVGSELRLLARLDPDVAVSLRGYVRWWA